MKKPFTRRDFLRDAAVTGIGVWIGTESWAQSRPKSPNDQIHFACIGVDGKGDSDSDDAARFGTIVAICDVDEEKLNKKAQQYPKARKYTDWRKMLDEMGRQVDACTVSTPDHSHAPATAMALHLGKHVYTQKPLAHSIYECRRLGELARRMRAATQMGNQGTADNSMRQNAYRVRAGALGAVREVHVWTNRPIWPQGGERSATKPVPATLHWDLWLGPAPVRPYGDNYHPFSWRGWWDFGTGALGDMACHTVNLPYMALELNNPISVLATTSADNHDSYPQASKIVYEFAANHLHPPLTMTWYDGGNLPPKELIPAALLPKSGQMPDSGSLIIGDKGVLYTPGDYGGGGQIVGGVDVGDVPYPVSPGHWEEFVRAMRGGAPATSNFPDYASDLAATVLLGNVGVWVAGQKVEWDHQHLRVTNSRDIADQVAHIIRPPYRPGYSL